MPASTGSHPLTPDFARDVRDGLGRPGQKELPSKYLYDKLGTALFEAITHLPEYGLTRADMRLLARLAGTIDAYVRAPAVVVELGSGNGAKSRPILTALAQRGRPEYFPIDVAAAALERCRRELGDVASVNGLEATYLDGLRHAAVRRPPGHSMLVMFVGSNIGNFDRLAAEAFLEEVRKSVEPGDALLLGADLMKPVERLLPAYDDPTGVTAAFNLNILGRINRELDGEFDLRRFAHEARWNPTHRRVEMHLRSLGRQRVAIPGAEVEVTLEEGETIWTEASHKFTLEELRAIAARTGFHVAGEWVDREWPFVEAIWIAADGAWPGA